jgi:hypothetical protein
VCVARACVCMRVCSEEGMSGVNQGKYDSNRGSERPILRDNQEKAADQSPLPLKRKTWGFGVAVTSGPHIFPTPAICLTQER